MRWISQNARSARSDDVNVKYWSRPEKQYCYRNLRREVSRLSSLHRVSGDRLRLSGWAYRLRNSRHRVSTARLLFGSFCDCIDYGIPARQRIGLSIRAR